MHSTPIQAADEAERQEDTYNWQRFDDLDREQFDADANSADRVISEIALTLVIVLGSVLAINLVLSALHVG